MAKKTGKTAEKSKTSKVVKRHPRLPSVWKLTAMSGQILWDHKKLFVGITLIYGVANLVLVQGLAASGDVASIKEQLTQATTGNFAMIASSLNVFTSLIGSAGNGSSGAAGAYQVFLALIVSLAVIWALRQLLAGSKIRVRDAYYKGMYPLVPFILVLVVIGLQLLPMLIGSTIYSLLVANGIVIGPIEILVAALLFALLALVSFYMISASLFALYIVTLPKMTPSKALRSARDLVKGRRWTVMRKILYMPLLLLAIAAAIMLPVILLLTPLAQWIFFALTMFGMAAVHTYLYTLYRELLNE